jgi:hypothetical protein
MENPTKDPYSLSLSYPQYEEEDEWKDEMITETTLNDGGRNVGEDQEDIYIIIDDVAEWMKKMILFVSLVTVFSFIVAAITYAITVYLHDDDKN